MPGHSLTPEQEKAYQDRVMEAINSYWHEHYISPNYSDVKALTGIRANPTIYAAVTGLVERDLLMPPKSKLARQFIPTWVKRLIELP